MEKRGNETESRKASLRMYLLFWGLMLPWMGWLAYQFWRNKALSKYEAIRATQREMDGAFFSSWGIGLWLLTVGCLLAFIFGPWGTHLPKQDRLWVLLAIGGGFLAIALRLLGVTSPL